MGHLGLTPQNMAQLGGYRVQGKTLAAAEQLVDDALALQEAGAFALLLEAVPSETVAFIRERLDVLVYGIGAGPHTDGQLVISHDILGYFVGEIRPRFVRRYADVDVCVTEAFRRYAEDVRAGAFPGNGALLSDRRSGGGRDTSNAGQIGYISVCSKTARR